MYYPIMTEPVFHGDISEFIDIHPDQSVHFIYGMSDSFSVDDIEDHVLHN